MMAKRIVNLALALALVLALVLVLAVTLTLASAAAKLLLPLTLTQLPQLLYPCSPSYCQTRRFLLTLAFTLETKTNY